MTESWIRTSTLVTEMPLGFGSGLCVPNPEPNPTIPRCAKAAKRPELALYLTGNMRHVSRRLARCLYILGVAVLSAQSQTGNSPSTQEAANADPRDVRDPVLYSTETDHFKTLVTKLARNVWLDQKDIWTSPFKIRTDGRSCSLDSHRRWHRRINCERSLDLSATAQHLRSSLH